MFQIWASERQNEPAERTRLVLSAYSLLLYHYYIEKKLRSQLLYVSNLGIRETERARANAATGWRRLIGSPKLQIIFHKRATKYRSLLRKMIYKDKGSYGSSPPCSIKCILIIIISLLYKKGSEILAIVCFKSSAGCYQHQQFFDLSVRCEAGFLLI